MNEGVGCYDSVQAGHSEPQTEKGFRAYEMNDRYQIAIGGNRAGPRARLSAAGIALLCFAGLISQPVPAQETLSFGGGFHSVMPPGKPALNLPSLGDITLWKTHMQKARRAFRRKKYVKARKNLVKALNKGNFTAAWYLGHLYRLGLGVKPDARKAFDYYRLVALKYSAEEPRRRVFLLTVDSLVRVAETYRKGSKKAGIPRDLPRALRILQLASGHGHPRAQYTMGVMYLNGTGVRKSARQAVKWLRLSAQKRYLPAQVLLGKLYWRGKRVRRNKVEALKWYALATRSTRPELYPGIYDRFDTLMAKSSERDIAAAEVRAAAWDKYFPVGRSAGIVPAAE